MSKSWTEHEIVILRERYLSTGREELEALLPNRTWAAIEQRANHLNLRRACEREYWTPDQIEVLKVEYPQGARLDYLANKLRKSPLAIKHAAVRLRIGRLQRQIVETASRRQGPLLAYLTDIQRGYLAGLFDGEGSVFIQNNKRNFNGLVVTISSTDPRVIQWLVSTVPQGRFSINKNPGPNRKPAYVWRLFTVDGIKFCQEIKDLLIIKRDEAVLVAEALKGGFSPLSIPQRQDLWQSLHTLKSKGHELMEL